MNKITERANREMHNHRRPDPDRDGASVVLVVLVPSMALEPKGDRVHAMHVRKLWLPRNRPDGRSRSIRIGLDHVGVVNIGTVSI